VASKTPAVSSVVVAEASAARDGVLKTSEKLVITWGATSLARIASQTVLVDGAAIAPIAGPYGGLYYSCAIGNWSAGTHSYMIRSTDSAGASSDVTGSFDVAAALMVDARTAPLGPAGAITNAQLAPIAAAAIQRLETQLGNGIETTMAGVSIKLANLPAGMLGETVGNTILIDNDAAGYGWFVDTTPGDDAEFLPTAAANTLAARPGSGVGNRADLLTTIMHEMGHVLGYDHSSSLDLMYPTLPLGERRLLAGGAATALTSDGLGSHRSSADGVLDDVFASLGEDGKREWRLA